MACNKTESELSHGSLVREDVQASRQPLLRPATSS